MWNCISHIQTRVKSEIERKLLAYKNFFLSIFFLSSYQLSHFCHFFFSFPFFWIWIWIQTWNLFFIFLLPCKLKFKFFEGRERERELQKKCMILWFVNFSVLLLEHSERNVFTIFYKIKKEKSFSKKILFPLANWFVTHIFFCFYIQWTTTSEILQKNILSTAIERSFICEKIFRWRYCFSFDHSSNDDNDNFGVKKKARKKFQKLKRNNNSKDSPHPMMIIKNFLNNENNWAQESSRKKT